MILINQAKMLEQAKASMESAIQSLLDTTARANGGWDNMMSARASAKPVLDTDSAEAIAMKTNANALEDWYFKTWGKSYQVQADVEAGTIPMPTIDELIAMLPTFGA